MFKTDLLRIHYTINFNHSFPNYRTYFTYLYTQLMWSFCMCYWNTVGNKLTNLAFHALSLTTSMPNQKSYHNYWVCKCFNLLCYVTKWIKVLIAQLHIVLTWMVLLPFLQTQVPKRNFRTNFILNLHD